MPFMLLIGIQNKFRTKFLTEDKLRYILYNTIITNTLIELPIFILLEIGIEISYKWNLIIWLSAVSVAFIIAFFQFEFLDAKLFEKLKIRNYKKIS